MQVFDLLNSPTRTLQQIWRQKYEVMVSADRSKIDPALLSPSPRAAFYHGLMVYHQTQVWRALGDTDTEPLSWDWRICNGKYKLITDIAAGPTVIENYSL